nr:MAG TPA: hypothetical protein [Caudoviricetes sp.]
MTIKYRTVSIHIQGNFLSRSAQMKSGYFV